MLLVEVRAIEVGVRAVVALSQLSLIVKSDNLLAMWLLNGKDEILTSIKLVVENIMELRPNKRFLLDIFNELKMWLLMV